VYDRLLEKAQYIPPGSTRSVRLPSEYASQNLIHVLIVKDCEIYCGCENLYVVAFRFI